MGARIRRLDHGPLIDYIDARILRGALADGESKPKFAAGITIVIQNPKMIMSEMFNPMAITLTGPLDMNHDKRV